MFTQREQSLLFAVRSMACVCVIYNYMAWHTNENIYMLWYVAFVFLTTLLTLLHN
jgi:hypothetical protein